MTPCVMFSIDMLSFGGFQTIRIAIQGPTSILWDLSPFWLALATDENWVAVSVSPQGLVGLYLLTCVPLKVMTSRPESGLPLVGVFIERIGCVGPQFSLSKVLQSQILLQFHHSCARRSRHTINGVVVVVGGVVCLTYMWALGLLLVVLYMTCNVSRAVSR